MREGIPGVLALDAGQYAACVHDGGRAAWGPARGVAAEALRDRVALTLALERGQLHACLARFKGLAPATTADAAGEGGPEAEADAAPSPLGSAVDELFGHDSDDGD